MFINEDLQIIGLFAEQSAVVLENIELFKQTYQYMEQLEKRVEERTAELRQRHG